jgi:hypothetical protein
MAQSDVVRLLTKYPMLSGKEMAEKTGLSSVSSNITKMIQYKEVDYVIKKNLKGQLTRYYFLTKLYSGKK